MTRFGSKSPVVGLTCAWEIDNGNVLLIMKTRLIRYFSSVHCFLKSRTWGFCVESVTAKVPKSHSVVFIGIPNGDYPSLNILDFDWNVFDNVIGIARLRAGVTSVSVSFFFFVFRNCKFWDVTPFNKNEKKSQQQNNWWIKKKPLSYLFPKKKNETRVPLQKKIHRRNTERRRRRQLKKKKNGSKLSRERRMFFK